MPTIKERIEGSPVVAVLAALATGFISGIGAYDGILRIAELEKITKLERERFDETSNDLLLLRNENEDLKKKLKVIASGKSCASTTNLSIICHENLANGISKIDHQQSPDKSKIKISLVDRDNKPFTGKILIAYENRDPEAINGGFYEIANARKKVGICIGNTNIGFKQFGLQSGFSYRFRYE